MKKIIVMLVLFFTSVSLVSASEFNLSSEYVIMYNFDAKELVYEKNIDQRVPIASLTKLFTVYFSIVNIENVNEKVLITHEMLSGLAAANASVVGLRVGDQVTYLDLLYASMLPSGADATKALAITLFGSEEKFASELSKYVQKLGLINTNFVNGSGLHHENHYSTVKDVLNFMLIALDNPLFKQIYEAREYVMSNGIKIVSTYKKINDNYNLGLDSYLLGTKTGYTNESGVCLASMAKMNGNTYLLITTKALAQGSLNVNAFLDAKLLYDYVFENYNYDVLYKTDYLISNIDIEYGKNDSYKINLLNDYYHLIKKDADYKLEYQGLTNISLLDYKVNSKIGVISIKENDVVIYSEDVFLDAVSISLLGYLIINKWLILTVIIIIAFIIVRRNKNESRKI